MSQTVRKAIIPVAGFGTRFLPATKVMPKSMMAVVDKPIIQYIVEEAVASGIEQIIFITGRGKRAIEDHFDKSAELEFLLESKGKHDVLEEVKRISDMASFVYVRQPEPLGLGHAISMAKDLVDNEPVAVLLEDDLIETGSKKPALRQLIDVYDKYNDTVIGVRKVPRNEVSRYGIVAGRRIDKQVTQIQKMVEKPDVKDAPSNLAVTGRYVLSPLVFEKLKETKPGAGNEIQITDAIASAIKETTGYACEYSGTYFDCGNKVGYLEANIHFALKHQDKTISRELRKFIKKQTASKSLS